MLNSFLIFRLQIEKLKRYSDLNTWFNFGILAPKSLARFLSTDYRAYYEKNEMLD